MKHLNPRQGITTRRRSSRRYEIKLRVKHLNPRQGITTLRNLKFSSVTDEQMCVKHLNPRQGITTEYTDDGMTGRTFYVV